MEKKNFIFFGTPRFAEIFLGELIENGLTPSMVITNPDRPAGRKKIITPPSVKTLAEGHGITVFQNKSETLNFKLGTSFGLVAAYGLIIPESVIRLFPKGVLCIHPSLLPELRGATPIQTALLENRAETGTTIFLLDKQIDHGAIIAQKKLAITGEDNYATLEEKLAKLSAELFSETIEKYLDGKIVPTPQDEKKATLTKKFSREDAFIEEKELKDAIEGKNSERVSAKIRAFSTEPGTWTIQNGKQIKLLECYILDGKLVLKKIQTEGKKPQTL